MRAYPIICVRTRTAAREAIENQVEEQIRIGVDSAVRYGHFPNRYGTPIPRLFGLVRVALADLGVDGYGE